MNPNQQDANEANRRMPWHCPKVKKLTVNLDSKTPSVSVVDFPLETDV